MPQPRNLDPSAWKADGGPVGVVLIHGFTGSVAETRPMGEYLAARGLTVRCPLLPGHGTTALDLTRIRWADWAGEVEAALSAVQARCPVVYCGGLSLGSLLALWLGAGHPELAGLIVMAPAVKVRDRRMPLTLGLRYLIKYNPSGGMGDADAGDPRLTDRIWSYDETPLWGAAEVYLLQRRVRRALGRVHQPVLIVQGRRDATLEPDAAQVVYDGVSSADRELVWLENSGHNILADGEREQLWARTYEWIRARAC